MRRAGVQWAVAVLVTLVSALWQRTTGPTYPARGAVQIGGHALSLRLERSHSINSRQPVSVRAADAAVAGVVEWRRYPGNEPFATEPLVRRGDLLEALLPPAPMPLMPAAGKLEYRVVLARGAERVAFPDRPTITRFKGDVPAWILIPHITAMFFGMLFSNRAALAALAGGDTRRPGRLTLLMLAFGGFVLGPIVQKLAFGAYWTGIPWGYDLTDNKTLIATAAWAIAGSQLRGGRPARWAVTAAGLVTLVVFAIPHSVWGSEVRW